MKTRKIFRDKFRSRNRSLNGNSKDTMGMTFSTSNANISGVVEARILKFCLQIDT